MGKPASEYWVTELWIRKNTFLTEATIFKGNAHTGLWKSIELRKLNWCFMASYISHWLSTGFVFLQEVFWTSPCYCWLWLLLWGYINKLDKASFVMRLIRFDLYQSPRHGETFLGHLAWGWRGQPRCGQ